MGALNAAWIAHDTRDELADFVRHWSEQSGICYEQLLRWIQLSSRKFRDWRTRYGQTTEHNHMVPRNHSLETWEKEAIVKFFAESPLEGYRRLCFMLDRDLVAVSPASVYGVLKAEGLLANRWNKPSRKGTEFVQPLVPHDHWHIDFCYVNVGGTLYYLCSILDGFALNHPLQAGGGAGSSWAPSQSGVLAVNNSALAMDRGWITRKPVHPEDWDLLGSDPSAAVNSNPQAWLASAAIGSVKGLCSNTAR